VKLSLQDRCVFLFASRKFVHLNFFFVPIQPQASTAQKAE
jgi:hypothetical protein